MCSEPSIMLRAPFVTLISSSGFSVCLLKICNFTQGT
jgi:hypothetical protein